MGQHIIFSQIFGKNLKFNILMVFGLNTFPKVERIFSVMNEYFSLMVSYVNFKIKPKLFHDIV